MKMLPLSFVLILLWAPLALSQPRQLVQRGGESDVPVTLITKTDCGNTLPKVPDDNAQYGIQRFKARGGDTVDWGLALSGGGIRSAGFSIGVMKVLYDEGYMDEVDVISSVSGGSYASYWLYTKHELNSRFGESAFEDNKFIKNVCRLQNRDKSDFVSNTLILQYLPIIVPKFVKISGLQGKVFNLYRDRITNSFGNDKLPSTKLCFLNSSIESREIPYFILNTTLTLEEKDKKRNEDLRRKSSKVFEITPEFRGNPYVGFREWANYEDDPLILTEDDPLTFSESAAASAIPRFVAKHKITNYVPRLVSGKKLQLYDGGYSENLGALALIRRGVKNVIIIDSEHDPHYKFKGYRDLLEMLDEIGIKFRIKAIDEFVNGAGLVCPTVKPGTGKAKKVFSCSAIAVGRATSHGNIPKGGDKPVESTIYYLKMSNPKMISFKRLLDDKVFKNARDDGEMIARAKQSQLGGDCENIFFDFQKEKDLYPNLYTFRVYKYENFLNNDLPFWPPHTWINVNFMNAVGKLDPDFIYKYPHTTTYDQSFYGDQVEAFVGLGYLQAKELVKGIQEAENRRR